MILSVNLYMARAYKQGLFEATNKQKYAGDHTKIVYRSSWELKLMRYLDQHQNILNWSSEETVIPYFYDVDQKWHRYFVDFKVHFIGQGGIKKTALIEVKPKAQVERPVKPKTNTRKAQQRYIEAIAEWIKNQQKWSAATSHCKDRGWEFIIFTEKELGVI
jgi:hypothetical protein